MFARPYYFRDDRLLPCSAATPYLKLLPETLYIGDLLSVFLGLVSQPIMSDGWFDQKVTYLDLGITLEWFRIYSTLFYQLHYSSDQPGVLLPLASTSWEVVDSATNLIFFINHVKCGQRNMKLRGTMFL